MEVAEIRNALHRTDPFDGLKLQPLDLQGWQSYESVFEELIVEVRPKLIVEVGTWKGASAIHMADLLVKHGLSDSVIVCVDTWLGSLEFWTNTEDETRYGALGLVNGYPSVYYTFLSNVVRCGHEKRIVPFPATSSMAAEWFTRKDLYADLAYLDASHEKDDVEGDLLNWHPRVENATFGDDYTTFEGVKYAVDEYAKWGGFNLQTKESKWIIR